VAELFFFKQGRSYKFSLLGPGGLPIFGDESLIRNALRESLREFYREDKLLIEDVTWNPHSFTILSTIDSADLSTLHVWESVREKLPKAQLQQSGWQLDKVEEVTVQGESSVAKVIGPELKIVLAILAGVTLFFLVRRLF